MRRPLACIAAWLVLHLCAHSGWAAEPSSPSLRLVVLPVERINLSQDEAERYLQRLEQVLAQDSRVVVRRAAAVLPHGHPPIDPGCGAAPGCLRALSEVLPADRLLALRAGRLAETVILRLTVYDAARNAQQGTWQEMLKSGERDAVSQAFERMVRGFLPPPPQKDTSPWYGRWWVWTITGAVVAGSVTAAVLATQEGGPEPDVTFRAP